MKATREIIPGFELPEDELIVYAENQPEYLQLPMWKGPEGHRVCRWKLTWRERITVLLNGSLWLSVLTFNRPLQPVKIDVSCPLIGHYAGDKEV